VNVDDEAGTLAAMKHLYDLGHRRIAYFGGEQPPHPSVVIRPSTYERFMREAGLSFDGPFTGPVDRFVGHFFSGSDTAQAPTAVVTFDHRPAVALLQQFWRRGVRVPEDVSVVTFNDAYPVEHTTPPLTVVALPVREIAVHAVRLLMEQIDQKSTSPGSVLLDERLIVRESTAPPRS
jgi:DNA-binding LacI/PurR family transcriptional regulator